MLVEKIKQLIQAVLLSRGKVLTMTMMYLKRKRGIHLPKYAGDYVRNSSFELVAHEIPTKKVPGNVAELGAYRTEGFRRDRQ